MGLTMVIDAHTVTPVPGYGAHGPFYRLYLIKPGYLAKIKWNGVWRTYRFVSKPTPYPQTPRSEIDKPIKNFGVEVVYFRCCWPRYTRNDYLTVRAVLVTPKHTEEATVSSGEEAQDRAVAPLVEPLARLGTSTRTSRDSLGGSLEVALDEGDCLGVAERIVPASTRRHR